MRNFYSLSQPHHVTASHSSPGDNHQSTGWAVRKNTGTSKNGCLKLIQLLNVPGLSTFSDLRALTRNLHRHSSAVQGHLQHHPSSLTSISLVVAIHLLPPSTPFWPYATHTFFPHAQTISILSDLLYSFTPFLFQLSYVTEHIVHNNSNIVIFHNL